MTSSKPDVVVRRWQMQKDGTFGTLLIQRGVRGLVPVCLTLENPWLNNDPKVSCVPAGSYNCDIIQSPSKGRVYTLRNVPGRTNILIHAGNTTHDTIGCILLGTALGEFNGVTGITSSQSALAAFMATMEGRNFSLVIEDQWRWYNGPMQ